MCTTTQQRGYNLIPDKSNIAMCCLGNRLCKNQKVLESITQSPNALCVAICNKTIYTDIINHVKTMNTDVSMAGLHFRLQRLHAIHSFASIILLVGEYLITANGLYDFQLLAQLLPRTPLLITWSKSPIRSYTLCFLEYSVICILCTAKNHIILFCKNYYKLQSSIINIT